MFLILFEILIKSQIFSPDWPKVSLIRAEQETNRGKHNFQEKGLVLHSFYVELPRINLFF